MDIIELNYIKKTTIVPPSAMKGYSSGSSNCKPRGRHKEPIDCHCGACQCNQYGECDCDCDCDW